MKNQKQYLHLDKVIAIYTFFQHYEVPLKFTFDDLYYCLTSNQTTYLVEYLMCFFFEKYLEKQEIWKPYPDLLLHPNGFIRQCLIYSQLPHLYQFVVEYHKEEKRQVKFSTPMEAEEKINTLYHLVNYIAQKSKWIIGIRENLGKIYQGLFTDKSFKEKQNKFQEELQEILNQKDEKQDVIRKIDSRKRIKVIQKEITTLDDRAQKITSLLSLNFHETKIFNLNPMKLVYKQKFSVWIIRSMPDYILVQQKGQYELLYGIEVHEFMKDNEVLQMALKEFNFCLKKKVVEIKDWVNFKDFPYDNYGLQQFLKIGGKKDKLVYCKRLENEEPIIMNIILEIEEKVTYFYGKYQQKAWAFQSEREKWRKELTLENAIDKMFDLSHMFSGLMSKYYDFSSNEEVPFNYRSKYVAFSWSFRNVFTDLDEVNNCPYTYAILLYSRFQEQYFIQMGKQTEIVKEEIKSKKQKKVIEDESDLSDYYYR